ncbi:MAG: DUF2158 domain-containing protein [Alphaproteobacteria bacterium]|nr:MAG: DUF2158 domain-containing protein [Alphaproteobacteria bacterium]
MFHEMNKMMGGAVPQTSPGPIGRGYQHGKAQGDALAEKLLEAFKEALERQSGVTETKDCEDNCEGGYPSCEPRSSCSAGTGMPAESGRPIMLGDVVRLKSGGPSMTVMSIVRGPANRSGLDVAITTWFADAARQSVGDFPSCCLELVPRSI